MCVIISNKKGLNDSEGVEMSGLKVCPFCGNNIIRSDNGVHRTRLVIECPVCGIYEIQTLPFIENQNIKDEIASYLYYHSNCCFPGKKYPHQYFIGEKDLYDMSIKDCEEIAYVSIEEILAFQPKSFTERIDTILLGLAEQSRFIGDRVKLSEKNSGY